MTITDKQYKGISNKVYWLDPKHPQYSKSYKEGAIKKLWRNKIPNSKNQRLIGRYAGDGCSANRP